MKKTILLLMAGLLFAGISISQNWAPQSSEWYYDFQSFNFVGYVKISNTGDTLINGSNCNILSKVEVAFDYSNGQYDTIFLGNEYMYSDEDKVYIYRQQSFFTLYDFGATAGDSWEIPALVNGVCDSTGKVIVDSTSTTVINNETLRVLYCRAYEDSHWTLGHTIIEKIGCIDSYMLPGGTANCGVADVYEAGALRCYSDDSFGLYNTGISESCDFITGINDFRKNDFTVGVYPNPAKDFVVFDVQSSKFGNSVIKIMDVYGNEVDRLKIDNEKTVWYTKVVTRGLYFYIIETGGEILSGKIVVQ